MKKAFRALAPILLVIALAIAMVTTAFSASKVSTASSVMVSLSGVATTGAGDDFRPTSGSGVIPFKDITWQTTFTGTPTAITVNLEGSIDGTNWFTLDTSTSTAKEMRHVVNKRVDYLRCNVSIYTVNGSTASCSFRTFN